MLHWHSTVNAQDLLTAIIAVGGFIGTIALLILNLKVQGSMSDMRGEVAVDMSRLQLEMANLRTESANDRANTYEKIMESMGRLYIPREVQNTQHQANIQRLDDLADQLKDLSARVGDIS